MSDWGRAVYGDPCRECGFGWSIRIDDAQRVVSTVPQHYATLIGDTDGSARAAGLEWSIRAYVCHVADNLCIWAERLVGAARGNDQPIVPYDTDLLARARNYDAVPVEGALWSLGRAVAAWQEAVVLAGREAVVLVHPERGPQAVSDVVRNNAHDAWHHGWDIERISRSG